jgi:hypothetical protein
MDKVFVFCVGFFVGIVLAVFVILGSFSPAHAAAPETIGSDDFGTIYEGKYSTGMELPCTPGDLYFVTFMQNVWKCENTWSMFSETPGEDWKRYWLSKGKEGK